MKVINPDAPEQYKYETDYRKIPRQYLNPRIPQGRTMKKWMPMATLPQQYEQLNDYIEEQNKIDMPVLSEEQITIMNDKLNDKINSKALTTVEYWKNGYMFSIQGYIKKVDVLESMLTITNERGNEKLDIPLNYIYNLD